MGRAGGSGARIAHCRRLPAAAFIAAAVGACTRRARCARRCWCRLQHCLPGPRPPPARRRRPPPAGHHVPCAGAHARAARGGAGRGEEATAAAARHHQGCATTCRGAFGLGGGTNVEVGSRGVLRSSPLSGCCLCSRSTCEPALPPPMLCGRAGSASRAGASAGEAAAAAEQPGHGTASGSGEEGTGPARPGQCARAHSAQRFWPATGVWLAAPVSRPGQAAGGKGCVMAKDCMGRAAAHNTAATGPRSQLPCRVNPSSGSGRRSESRPWPTLWTSARCRGPTNSPSPSRLWRAVCLPRLALMAPASPRARRRAPRSPPWSEPHLDCYLVQGRRVEHFAGRALGLVPKREKPAVWLGSVDLVVTMGCRCCCGLALPNP